MQDGRNKRNSSKARSGVGQAKEDNKRKCNYKCNCNGKTLCDATNR